MQGSAPCSKLEIWNLKTWSLDLYDKTLTAFLRMNVTCFSEKIIKNVKERHKEQNLSKESKIMYFKQSDLLNTVILNICAKKKLCESILISNWKCRLTCKISILIYTSAKRPGQCKYTVKAFLLT